MRRLLRILLNAATVLSLVLCAAAIVLWVRAYWMTDQIQRQRTWRVDTGVEFRILQIATKRGRVAIYHRHIRNDGTVHNQFLRYLLDIADTTKEEPIWRDVKYAGADWYYEYDAPLWKPLRWRRYDQLLLTGSTAVTTVVELANWAVVGLFGILPAAALCRLMWPSSRRVQGLCPACGYDLRATPDRCPECGTAMLQTKQI